MPKRQSKIWSSNDIKPWRLKERDKQVRPYSAPSDSHQGTLRMTETQEQGRISRIKKTKDKQDRYVPVKADPPEVRGPLGWSKNKSAIPTLLERLGPDAQDFSREATPELVAARIRVSNWIEHCDPEMPVVPNVTVDFWLGQAMAERIRGADLQNRKVTEAQVETLLADMLRPGAWKPNGDSIRFTPNGQVIDGQGRLVAFLLACRRNPKLTFVTDLRFNVPPEAFSTIDTGKKRTSRDVLGMAQIPNGYLMSAIARLWHGYHSGRMKRQHKLTNDQVLNIVTENFDLFHEATKLTANAMREVKVPGAVLGFAAALALRTDKGKAEAFFEQLGSGLNLQQGDPAYVLNRAVKNKAKATRKGADRIEAAALTIKALNAHFEKQSIDVVRWGRNEPFPRFIGDSKRNLTPEMAFEDDDTEGVSVAEMADA